MSEKDGMVRINTRISKKANEWLDRESATNGIPKSTLVLLAVENYIQQKEVMAQMTDMGTLLQKLEEIERKIEK